MNLIASFIRRAGQVMVIEDIHINNKHMRRNLPFLFILVLLIFTQCQEEKQETYIKKKHLILDYVADNYTPPSLNIGDPEKYVWPKVIARFEKYGLRDSLAVFYLDSLKNNSPFHFTLLGMARIMSLYEDAPFFNRQNKLAILKGVFEREDSFNPWTAEGTENHVNMSRTSGYLLAQHALDFPDEFPEAKEKMALMKRWMKEWAGNIYKYGSGEWHSSIYQAYNFIGWLNVYDFADDPEVKRIARAVLDYYATELAIHYSYQLPGGSEMRGKGYELNGRSATTYFNWLWFSPDSTPVGGLGGSQLIQVIHGATSTYRPNKQIVDLAINKKLPAYYRGSNPSYNFEHPAYIKKYFYAGKGYTLGSSVNNYGGFFASTFQYVPWKIIIRNKEGFPFVVAGNGHYYKTWKAKGRDPYTQHVQHENILMQITRMPANVEEYTKQINDSAEVWDERAKEDIENRFPTETYRLNHNLVNRYDKHVFENQSYINLPKQNFTRTEKGYLVCYQDVCLSFISLNPEMDTVIYKDDRMILLSRNEKDQFCGFVLEVASPEMRKNIHQTAHLNVRGDHIAYYSEDTLDVHFVDTGSYIEALVDWGWGPKDPSLFSYSPPFRQPDWPEDSYGARIPEVYINGIKQPLDQEWPVYEGPDISLENAVLQIEGRNKTWEIDFSGEIPEF